MRPKADSPRIMVRVPVPFRDRAKKQAMKRGMSMLDYLDSVVPDEELELVTKKENV